MSPREARGAHVATANVAHLCRRVGALDGDDDEDDGDERVLMKMKVDDTKDYEIATPNDGVCGHVVTNRHRNHAP